MIRISLSAVALLCSSTAWAGAPQWTVSESSGPVNIIQAGTTKVAQRGGALSIGDVIETGALGRAVLVRGQEYLVLSPNSRLGIADPARSGGFIQIVQNWGSAIFKIEKKTEKHFAVKTPYLAAVVKGTTFNITVDDKGARVQVTEGRVEVATPDGKAVSMILPGEMGLVSAADVMRLRVQGLESRSIDSPGRAADGEKLSAAEVKAEEKPREAATEATATETKSEKDSKPVRSGTSNADTKASGEEAKAADAKVSVARASSQKVAVVEAPTRAEANSKPDNAKPSDTGVSSQKVAVAETAVRAEANSKLDSVTSLAKSAEVNVSARNSSAPARNSGRIVSVIGEGEVKLSALTSGMIQGDSSLIGSTRPLQIALAGATISGAAAQSGSTSAGSPIRETPTAAASTSAIPTSVVPTAASAAEPTTVAAAPATIAPPAVATAPPAVRPTLELTTVAAAPATIAPPTVATAPAPVAPATAPSITVPAVPPTTVAAAPATVVPIAPAAQAPSNLSTGSSFTFKLGSTSYTVASAPTSSGTTTTLSATGSTGATRSTSLTVPTFKLPSGK